MSGVVEPNKTWVGYEPPEKPNWDGEKLRFDRYLTIANRNLEFLTRDDQAYEVNGQAKSQSLLQAIGSTPENQQKFGNIYVSTILAAYGTDLETVKKHGIRKAYKIYHLWESGSPLADFDKDESGQNDVNNKLNEVYTGLLEESSTKISSRYKNWIDSMVARSRAERDDEAIESNFTSSEISKFELVSELMIKLLQSDESTPACTDTQSDNDKYVRIKSQIDDLSASLIIRQKEQLILQEQSQRTVIDLYRMSDQGLKDYIGGIPRIDFENYKEYPHLVNWQEVLQRLKVVSAIWDDDTGQDTIAFGDASVGNANIWSLSLPKESEVDGVSSGTIIDTLYYNMLYVKRDGRLPRSVMGRVFLLDRWDGIFYETSLPRFLLLAHNVLSLIGCPELLVLDDPATVDYISERFAHVSGILKSFSQGYHAFLENPAGEEHTFREDQNEEESTAYKMGFNLAKAYLGIETDEISIFLAGNEPLKSLFGDLPVPQVEEVDRITRIYNNDDIIDQDSQAQKIVASLLGNPIIQHALISADNGREVTTDAKNFFAKMMDNAIRAILAQSTPEVDAGAGIGAVIKSNPVFLLDYKTIIDLSYSPLTPNNLLKTLDSSISEVSTQAAKFTKFFADSIANMLGYLLVFDEDTEALRLRFGEDGLGKLRNYLKKEGNSGHGRPIILTNISSENFDEIKFYEAIDHITSLAYAVAIQIVKEYSGEIAA